MIDVVLHQPPRPCVVVSVAVLSIDTQTNNIILMQQYQTTANTKLPVHQDPIYYIGADLNIPSGRFNNVVYGIDKDQFNSLVVLTALWRAAK